MGPSELIGIAFVGLFWLLPAYLVGRYAYSKGYSYYVASILALFISFLVVGLIVYLLPPRDADGSQPDRARSSTDELERLARVHADGGLTDVEFGQAKARVLNR